LTYYPQTPHIDIRLSLAGPSRISVVEVRGSHAVYVSQPGAVADLTAQAANSLTVSTP